MSTTVWSPTVCAIYLQFAEQCTESPINVDAGNAGPRSQERQRNP